MYTRYVKIIYYDGTTEKRPLRRGEDVTTVLQGRSSVVGHSVHTRWWCCPLAWATKLFARSRRGQATGTNGFVL